MLAAVPAYDPNDVATVLFGPSDAAIATGGTLGTSGSTPNRVLFGRWDRLEINQPCVLNLTKVVTYLNLDGTATCDQFEFVVVHCDSRATSGPTSTYPGTEIFYKLLGTGPWSTAGKVEFLLDEAITITAAHLFGNSIYYNVARRKPTGGTGNIGDRRSTIQVGANVGALYNNDAASIRDLLATTPGTTGYLPLNRLEFTTTCRKLLSKTAKELTELAATSIRIPRIVDKPMWIAARNIVSAAANGKAGFNAVVSAADASHTVIGGFVLDFNADTVGFGAGATRNTYAMGAGAQAEAYDDVRDVYLAITPSGEAELFDVNREVGQGPHGASDRAVKAHGVQYGGARDNPITLTGGALPDVLVMSAGSSGTCTLVIGWEPLVIFGDSRAGQMWAGYGNMFGAFTQPRMEIPVSIDGNRINYDAAGVHTSMKDRYKHATLTRCADVCEMTRFGVVFAIAGGPGTNDASFRAGGWADQAAREADVDGWVEALSGIIDDALANGSEVTLCIGPSAHTSYVEFNASMRAAMDYLAVQLRALAATKTITAVDAHAIAHRDQNTYLDTASVHYTTTGRGLIGGDHAAAYELGGLPQVDAAAGSGGGVDPESQTLAYGGNSAAITATPDEHYIVSSPLWTGDVAVGHEDDNPLSLTDIREDKSCMANFLSRKKNVHSGLSLSLAVGRFTSIDLEDSP